MAEQGGSPFRKAVTASLAARQSSANAFLAGINVIARTIVRILPLLRFIPFCPDPPFFRLLQKFPILTIIPAQAIWRIFRPLRLGSFQVSFREVTGPKESPGRIENRATDASDPTKVQAGG